MSGTRYKTMPAGFEVFKKRASALMDSSLEREGIVRRFGAIMVFKEREAGSTAAGAAWAP